jgi:hypothetical protein
MFFAHPARSFANLRKGLKPGGRLAFACWREAKQNPWLILPLREATKHAPPLPETNPEDPGPFAFASEARVRKILSDAGFADIVLEPHDLELDIAVGGGPTDRPRRVTIGRQVGSSMARAKRCAPPRRRIFGKRSRRMRGETPCRSARRSGLSGRRIQPDRSVNTTQTRVPCK